MCHHQSIKILENDSEYQSKELNFPTSFKLVIKFTAGYYTTKKILCM